MSNKLKNKQLKQIQNQAQDGRSMVEMLGVLAIVGVLSIGGITGYSWGMDKHVANQILNEMNLNSLQLAMLLQKGNPDGVTLALGSPYDDENPTFRTVNYGFQYGCGENADVADPECEYINETRYFITALDLPERVQKMVAESAENLQYATAVETDETDGFVTVFFDVDSGVTEYESRSEETEPYETEPHYTPIPEVTEPTTTTTTTEATTPETTTTEATTTTTTTVTTTYSEGCIHGQWTYVTNWNDNSFRSCQCNPGFTGKWCEQETNECDNNSDCKDNQYCHYASVIGTGPIGKGSCHENTGIEANGFIAKNENMDWWSAKNFCESHNKSMASIDDLNCADKIEKGKTGYCHQTSAGNTNRNDSNISSTVTELREKFGSYVYWLSDMYKYDNSCYSYTDCYSYGVFLNISEVGILYLYNYGHGRSYALCK